MLAPMSNPPVCYSSYLIRLWQEHPSDGADAHGWRAEVEHIQTGERRHFGSPDALWRYLSLQLAPGVDATAGASAEV